MDEPMENEQIEKIRDLIGEHFTNYVFAVEGVEGDFHAQWSTPIVGKALLETALQHFNGSQEIEWGDWDDEEEQEDWQG